MTSSHGRKSRARNKSRRQGAAYAAANADTLHQHDSGPSSIDLQPADPSRWGLETAPDMRTASGLIGACIERCSPCQESLAAKLLNEDPIALAVTAGAVYNLHATIEPDAESPADKPIRIFYLHVLHARLHSGDARLLPVTVERMPRADRTALLDAALELWTRYEPKHLGLVRGQGRLSDLTASSDPTAARPGAEAGVHHVAGDRPPEGIGPAGRLAAYGRSSGRPVPHAVRTRPQSLHRPPETTPRKEIPIRMSENTENLEQNAEGAARSLVELVQGRCHVG